MQTIVITGANRSIGLELTKRFLAAGDAVVAGCRTPAEATALNALGVEDRLRVLALDVTDENSVSAFCAALAGQTVDVLINNAGVIAGPRQSLADMDFDAWREAFEINTMAPFRLAQGLLENLKPSARPRIVTISSMMGALSRQSTGSYAYRSTKAAVNKVMQVMAVELAEAGIIVCPVHPGWVRTDMGGPGADISVEESAQGLFGLISSLTLGQSGRFWTWGGEELDW